MGVETSKAIRAKQRETAARIKRLIARRDGHGPTGRARRARISAAIRAGRAALRAWVTAQGAVESAEARVGEALVRMNAEGLSFHEAFAVLGLSRGVGRRFVELSRPRPHPEEAGPSTASGAVRDEAARTQHRDRSEPSREPASHAVVREGRS